MLYYGNLFMLSDSNRCIKLTKLKHETAMNY